MTIARAVRAAASVTCALASVACHKRDAVVARLEAAVAKVERMPQDAAPWQPASVGDDFVVGSALRTGSASSAELAIGASGKLHVKDNALVRFSRKGGTVSGLRIETGGVELEAGDDAIGFGAAVLEPHGRARVVHGPDGETIEVAVGQVELEDDTRVGPGQIVTIPAAGGRAIVVAAGAGSAGSAGSAGELVGDVLSITVAGTPAHVVRGGIDATLPPGRHRLDPHAAVVIAAAGSVEVAQGGKRVVASGAGRLEIGDDLAHLEIASGAVALHAAGGELVAAVPGGKLVVRDGGDAAAEVSARDGTAIDDVHGVTDVTGAHAAATLAAGDAVVLDASGAIEKLAPSPDKTELSIPAGETAVIHDARAPVAVHLTIGDVCLGGGVVEVARDRGFKRLVARARGAGAANIAIPAGTFVYRVRCDAGDGAHGSLQVVRDSGRAALPRTAARTSVDMDGREYTILYQNLLPELTLAWRGARVREGIAFVVQPKQGKPRRYPSAGPELSLRAGELGEGRYTVWGEVGAARSEQSRIVIEFDNATPSASIASVEVRDGKLHVKGTVIDGSSVTARGAAVQLDRQRRFDTEVAPGADEDGGAIRIAQPKLGVHYYVMRLSAS